MPMLLGKHKRRCHIKARRYPETSLCSHHLLRDVGLLWFCFYLGHWWREGRNVTEASAHLGMCLYSSQPMHDLELEIKPDWLRFRFLYSACCFYTACAMETADCVKTCIVFLRYKFPKYFYFRVSWFVCLSEASGGVIRWCHVTGLISGKISSLSHINWTHNKAIFSTPVDLWPGWCDPHQSQGLLGHVGTRGKHPSAPLPLLDICTWGA